MESRKYEIKSYNKTYCRIITLNKNVKSNGLVLKTDIKYVFKN